MPILVHCICTYLHDWNDWADLLRNVKEIKKSVGFRAVDTTTGISMTQPVCCRCGREQTSNGLENASLHSSTDEVNSLSWGYWCLIDFGTSAIPFAWLSVHKQFDGISEVHQRWGTIDCSLCNCCNCVSGTAVACRNKNEYEKWYKCIPDQIILILVCKWLWFIYPLTQASQTEAVANDIKWLLQ